MARVPTVLVREMGCTPTEFARWLPGATRNAPLTSNTDGAGTRHCLQVEGGTVGIELQPCAPRRIAAFTIPVLLVTFRFDGLDEAARSRFLVHFDHYTRRGGG